MNKRKKQIFAFLLAMAMIVGCLPAMAFAEEKEGWSSDHSKYFYYKDGELVASDVEVDKTIKPTCTTGTITVYRAKDTGDTDEVEANDALGHVYDKGKTTKSTATCDKAGYHYNVCDRCGEADEEHKITDPALGHKAAKEAVRENEKSATCTEDGSYDEVIYCETCGEPLSSTTKKIPATGEHTWKEENTEEKKPTCTEAGSVVVKRTCEVCGETETETVTTEALGHDWKLTKTTKKATCGKDGEGEYTCSRCKAKETRPIPATGEHKYEWKQIYDDPRFQAPTCEEEGYVVYANICKNCGHEEEDSRDWYWTEKLGHDYKKVSTEATCTLSGQAVYTCERCGDTYKKIEPALGHEFEKDKDGEEIVTETVKTAATCTEEGIMTLTRHCTRCGEDISEEEPIDPAGHKLLAPVKENVKAATCTKAGSHDDVVYCSVCKKVIEEATERGVVDEATGHDWDEENPAERTCKGTIYKCKKCGDILLDKQDTADHDWKLTKTKKAATCTDAGVGEYTCNYCGTKEDQEIPALGHDWSIIVKEPTCTEPGVSGGTCKRCKEMEDHVEVPALGHTYKESATTAKVYWDGTAKGTGYVLYTTPCANGCGNNKTQVVNFEADEKGEKQYAELKLMKDGKETTVKVEFIAKKTGVITKEPTCEAVGEKTYTATFEQTLPSGKTVSGKDQWVVNDEEELKAKGHTNGEAVKENVVEADCSKEKDGKYDLVVYCTVCGKQVSKNTITEKSSHTWSEEPVKENVKNEDSDTLPTEYDLVYYCTVCGKKQTDPKPQHVSIPKNGHVADEPVIENRIEPDCKNGRAGSYDLVVYCKDCDPKVEMWRMPMIIEPKHDYERVITVIKEATCKEKGKVREEKVCQRCGEVDEDEYYEWETGPLNHEAFFTKTVTTKEPTCTEEGATAEVTYCGICFDEVKRSKETKVPALGHTAMGAVRENEVAATCTEDGSYDEVVYCAVCNEEISRETKAVKAEGHKWDNGVITKAPTADEKGIETFTCLVCGETRTEEIDNSEMVARAAAIADAKAVSKQAGELDASEYKKDSVDAVKAAKLQLDKVLADESATTRAIEAASFDLMRELDKAEKKEVTRVILNNKQATYTGKVHKFTNADAKITGSKGKVTFKYFADVKCTKPISADKLVNTGTYYAKAYVKADDNFAASESTVARLKITRQIQSLTAKGKTITVKESSLKKAAKTFAASKGISVKDNVGKITYKKLRGDQNIRINSAGKITVKKGLKAGTYEIEVYVHAAKTKNYTGRARITVMTVVVK